MSPPPPAEIRDQLSVGCYHILSCNLKGDSSSVISLLCDSPDGPQLSPDIPTLFLAECVLVYIPTASSNALLTAIANRFTSAAFINYEQVKCTISLNSFSYDQLKKAIYNPTCR